MEKKKLGSGMLFKPVNQAGLRASPTPLDLSFPTDSKFLKPPWVGFSPWRITKNPNWYMR